jgi:hypothetical protein
LHSIQLVKTSNIGSSQSTGRGDVEYRWRFLAHNGWVVACASEG